jgi:ATP-binding cassette subfamily G (WHITE) protein 5 (sterolin 1)
MADLALSQVANRCTEHLTQSEYRRLMIGIQLIKDPVVLLLDEPTWDLDPLNTYLVVSILSNASKKYGTAIILTMEKPRSDVFPFLERVLYLCLGDVVYTGGTRQMLEYFNAIGFPCPQLENPLMYYRELCDRSQLRIHHFYRCSMPQHCRQEVEGALCRKQPSDSRSGREI